MLFEEFLLTVDRWHRQNAELVELRRAVGPYPWRMDEITKASGKPISETMTALLALVTFDGYELFPARRRRDDQPRRIEGESDRNV